MVSFGSKALPLRRLGGIMGDEDNSHKRSRKKMGMSRKPDKQSNYFDANVNKNGSGRGSQRQSDSETRRSVVRKQVDPETTKYFSEIANLIESNGVDMEERSVVCGNALEEARGKEFELATDYYLSHTMQTLLEGCDVNSLCSFLQSCAKDFPSIAMDRSGSHVAETAIKSLSQHLQDNDVYSVIEDTLNAICKVIVKNPGDLMCDCYGSHVLRSLLSLFKGVPLDSSEFNRRKSSSVLAERLNFKAFRADTDISPQAVQGFPGLLDFLVSGMSKCIQNNIKTMQVDQYSSLVLQSALKLLAGDEEKLLQIIPILIGCTREEILEGDSIKTTKARNILYLMKETAFSHLMEVALEVAPEVLYNEMFTKVFRNSLFELSSHHCGNFVIQALISHAGSLDQMEVIWEELGSKFKDLLKMGKSGVIASLIAASQRLHIYEHKCCEALAMAVHSSNESSTCIVPRILFLDSYFYCEDKSNWNWPSGAKMHVMGSLILQGVFRFQNEFIQPFITSITSLNADNILEAAKDSGGARVIEAFLSSDASAKLKRRIIMKLRGHFGELSLQSSGSFTVEKCFTVGNISLREAIVSELLTVQSELWNTKQGPHLMRKLDVDGFAARPDQWRSRQESKQSTFNEFYSTFGSSETKPSKNSSFLSDDSKKTSQPNKIKQMREEIAHLQTSPAPFLSTTGFKRKPNKPENSSKKFARNSADDDVPKVKNKSKNIVTDT
ncbi:PREDICTED: pumilio homolog 23 isoform X1 [Prunus mume]|uniref:Pumilio homolog 23 isoform X1 n=3 Tax=Prunus mume TaxID=102107 RepID=A0ABM1LQ81_PRUMU|nr:PREDICTED: pumilio homolog 23 isoform X1 [Prunus mume]XP_016649558.1 PREDICTED: pumilio homolog 23 isoform X1 [Prunus mume]